MLTINLLGTPEIYLDTPPNLHFRTRKAQALLIYLAVTGRRWSRDALATLFWPETDDFTARKNLRDILPSLRRQLDEYLLLDDESIGLNTSGLYKCDVTHFCAVLERPLPTVEMDKLAAALALYRGEFLEGYASSKISADFELWTLRERERLHQLALMGFTTLCRRQQEGGEYDAALATNRQLLKLVPWDEAAHRRQMLLLAQNGQPAAALAHFEACRQILADELDVEPDEETITLFEQIKAGHFSVAPAITVGQNAPKPSPSAPVRHNLPRQLTSLIGREADIDAVQRLLSEENTALLTLVGQGGVGKTRLALAVAQHLRQQGTARFPDGIWFVPLAGVASGENATEQIAGAIAQAMGLSLSGSALLSKQIIRALQEQKLLLILDNFDHLLAEQSFLVELVQTAQQAKLLVTSREQLHLHAEFLYPVVGLPTPPSAAVGDEREDVRRFELDERRQMRPPSPANVGQYASVQLFVTRVQQRLPEFSLTPKEQPPIGRICHLLGGVPLGIELTAQLYVEQGRAILPRLIEEIEQLDPLDPLPPTDPIGLDHLQSAAIDLPARHRSIRTVFVYSWQLLTAAEQNLLRHCAIFRGGFTREAILAVGKGDGANLLSLVMKSLVRRDSHERYDLHELVRQYVIDQFQQEPLVVHAVAQKHATYFLDLLAGQEEKLLQQLAFHETIQTEIYNIRAAWAWSLDQAAIAELESVVICLFTYLRFAGYIQERFALATQTSKRLRALPKGGYPEQARNRLLGYLFVYAASAGMNAGLVAESERWLEEAEQMGEELEDPGLLGHLYTTQVSKSKSRLEYHQMVVLGRRALHWVKAANLPYLQIGIHEAISMGLAYQGELKESLQVAAELEQLIQTHGYRCVEAAPFFLKSKLYEFQWDWEAALRTAEQGQALCKEHGHIIGLDNVEGNMIWANLQLGNFAQVRELAIGFGARARRSGQQVELLYSLQTLALAEIGLKHWQAGEAYLTEALKLAVKLNNLVRQVMIQHQLGKLSIRQAAYNQAIAHFQDALQSARTIVPLPELQALAQAGLALVHLRQGELAQALRKVELFLGTAKTITPDGPDYGFVGLVIVEILRAHQDPRAAAILDQLYNQVQTQAGKIQDAAQRTRFLENIGEHREIVALWASENR